MDLSQYLHPDMIAKLQTGGYIIMLILMIVEWPIITFIAGFLASLWVFDIWVVLLFGTLWDMWGDLIFLLAGRYGLNLFEKKDKTIERKKTQLIETLDKLIQNNMFLSIFIIKFTPYAPPIWLAYIGKIGVRFREYFLSSLFFSITIPFLIGMAWYHLQRLNVLITQYTGWEIIWGLIVTILMISGIIWWFLYLKRKSEQIISKQ